MYECTPCFDTETMCLLFTFHIPVYYTVSDVIASIQMENIAYLCLPYRLLYFILSVLLLFRPYFAFTQTSVLRIPSIFRQLQYPDVYCKPRADWLANIEYINEVLPEIVAFICLLLPLPHVYFC